MLKLKASFFLGFLLIFFLGGCSTVVFENAKIQKKYNAFNTHTSFVNWVCVDKKPHTVAHFFSEFYEKNIEKIHVLDSGAECKDSYQSNQNYEPKKGDHVTILVIELDDVIDRVDCVYKNTVSMSMEKGVLVKSRDGEIPIKLLSLDCKRDTFLKSGNSGSPVFHKGKVVAFVSGGFTSTVVAITW
ncbi:MAG: hypothetical protein QG614_617 [Patescibacteria group bacterium]|nr:hypothetical protein [Patescibacteria group bacterium]